MANQSLSYTEAFPVSHGLLFHHFHDASHPVGQGSISCEELYEIVDRIGLRHFLDAGEWMERARVGQLQPTDLCLTFDDNLRCQYDVARPVLDALGIRAFWFVYTSPLQGVTERLELYRYFRSVQFPDFDSFFAAFLDYLAATPHGQGLDTIMGSTEAATYLDEFPFYSLTDRQFRYLRDVHLGEARYDAVMKGMINASSLAMADIHSKLWMDAKTLLGLVGSGHVVGTHSHTHPTRIEMLSDGALRDEHVTSHRLLADLLGISPRAMSHPCNMWDDRTLDILDDLGFEIGFAARLEVGQTSRFLHPRHDHADVMTFLGMRS